ncbi:hypothetical protein Q8F55_005140 [Vanrija albida]|uniref:Alpha-N-acetylglucosaminidase n=1 Tax=Vanrija albida TaxID=181172 RepID=A0ABR3Q1A3_9TREE
MTAPAPWTPVGAEPSGPGALQALVERRLPASMHDKFTFVLDPSAKSDKFDAYAVSARGGHVTITSATTPGLSRGLLAYLRTLGGDMFWSGDTFTDALAPRIADAELTGGAWAEVRYFLNIVAHSYTLAYYDWPAWERLLDWAALHGITMPLAVGGQEAVWLEVFRDFGLEDADILTYLPSAGFKAWMYMGNTHGSWTQRVSLEYVAAQWELQKRVVARMVAFGMTPVLPGFSGFVPAALQDKLGGPEFLLASRWNDMPDEYSCNSALEPTWDSFATVQAAFLRKQQALYGGWTSHHYAVDLYNELHPSSTDPAYLAANARATMDSLKAADPHAVWVMQAWCFRDDVAHWPPEAVQGFLSGTTQDEHLILDLAAEHMPYWDRSANYHGKRWVWCTLHDYGQNHGLFGALDAYAAGLADARKRGGNLVGIGLAPEGLDQNEVVYQRALDAGWDEGADLGAWLGAWVARRYQLSPGARDTPAHAAWAELAASAYSSNDARVHGVYRSVFDMVPALGMLGKGGHFFGTIIPYDPAGVVRALDHLLAAENTSPAFFYDLVDVARQALLNAGVPFYTALISAWNARDAAGIRTQAALIADLLRDVDALLATNERHLLAPWIAAARAHAATEADADALELDARNQILLWGTGSATPWGLDRYAAKHWHGVVGTAYARSWELFAEYLLETPPDAYDHPAWCARLEAYEKEWQAERWGEREGETWGTVGDPVEVAARLRAKWAQWL